MKKFTCLAFAAIGLLVISSCTKTVIDMDAQNGNNSSGSSAGTSNNGGSSTNNKFDWTGTAPFSVKINGANFNTNPDDTHPYNEFPSSVNKSTVSYSDMADTSSLLLDFPTNAEPGTIYSSLMTYTWPNINFHGSGKVKIITNNATEVEGYFYGTISEHGNTYQITEGYFKVNKE